MPPGTGSGALSPDQVARLQVADRDEAPAQHLLLAVPEPLLHVAEGLDNLTYVLKFSGHFAINLRDEGPLAEANFFKNFQDHPLGDFHTFAGFGQIKEWEEAYMDTTELAKYNDSIGYQPGDG